jgi:general secretion pathway protein K
MRRGEQGFALVIALLVMTLLVALLVEFVNEVYVDTSHSHNFVAQQQAAVISRSGIDGGVALLKISAAMRAGKQYSSLREMWAQPITRDVGKGTISISIEEESGKLDLNSATSQTGTPDVFYQKAMQRLLQNQGLTQDLYDTLWDWVDTDDTPRPNGAESAYYETLKPPYLAHNNRLRTFEELGMVKGYTPEVLLMLRPFVTCYGSGPGLGPTASININTAPKEVLAALDDSLVRGGTVQAILDYRKDHEIENIPQIPGLPAAVAQALALKVVCQGTVYRIHAEGKVGDAVHVTEAVVTNVTGLVGQPTILYWREY